MDIFQTSTEPGRRVPGGKLWSSNYTGILYNTKKGSGALTSEMLDLEII